jgi:hypothetical protein
LPRPKRDTPRVRLSPLSFASARIGSARIAARRGHHPVGLHYCSIKPENMLIDVEACEVKLADFGNLPSLAPPRVNP